MDNKILYLEIDEEITSVIDRLKKTAETEVHLVVPKEAALLQSIVNLKLLKRQADTLGKEIQIITHDKVGRNLAEQVGIQSVSKIGEQAKKTVQVAAEPANEIKFKEKEPVVQETKEVVFKKGSVLGGEDPLEEPAKEIKPVKPVNTDSKGVQKKKMSELLPKFPHKKFLIIASAVGLVLLIFLYIFIPMANITLKVAAEQRGMKADFTIDKNTNTVDNSSQKIPGDLISVNKTETKTYQATGKKNIGSQASGTITVQNTYSTVSQTLVAGTRFEANGLVFRTQSDVNVPGYSDSGGGNITAGSANVSVLADSPGDQYNISSSDFRIPAFAGTAEYDKMTGTSAGQMSGGTTKNVNVVTDSDISNASNSFAGDAKTDVQKDGQDKMKSGETINDKAQKTQVGSITASKNAGDEADNFTLSANVSYKALAYKKDDLNKLVYNNLKSQTGPGKQILEDKLDNVDVTINDVNLDQGTISGEAAASVHLGTKIDQNQVKTEISGESAQKAKDYLAGLDGVDSVDMKFFPSFLKSIPRIKSHIYIKTDFEEKQ